MAVELVSHLPRSAPVELVARIADAAGRTVAEAHDSLPLAAGAAATHRLSLQLARPHLWGPDSPYLYAAEVSVLLDGRVTYRTTTRFGVRTIAVSPATGLTINGQGVKLKGACIHADHGILGAAAIDAAEYRKVELLKRNGYNAVRLAHNMYPPAFLDACDEAGLIVIDELYDTWEEQKVFANDYSRFFRQNWQRDVAHWVRRDRNHPSVVFWSIGNEIPERVKPRGVEIAAALREAILELDTSRLITAGVNGPTGEEGEPARRSLDVIGYNYQQHAFEPDHAANPNLTFVSTEQSANNICKGWRLVEAHPWVLGEFVWTAIDYLGEVGVGATLLYPDDPALPRPRGFALFNWDYPAFQSGCGEIDILGTRKPQGLYRDVLWGRSALELLVQRPTPPGTHEWRGPWAWHDELESWTWPDAGERPMTIRAYTSGDEVRLLLNGREVGRSPVAFADELTATFETAYAPGELLAIAFRDGQEIARKTLQTVGAPAQVRLRAERSRIDASSNDLAWVFAEVVDADGRQVPDAVVELTFALDGAGTLRATGSANPRGIKSFSDPRTRTFHGEALAIVQGTTRRGQATLRVSSPGLEGDAVAIEVG
jgi:beta-galactosidase